MAVSNRPDILITANFDSVDLQLLTFCVCKLKIRIMERGAKITGYEPETTTFEHHLKIKAHHIK